MNGFANAILSLLLGWLRSVFNAVWVVLGSDGSGDTLRFLRENWQLIFIVLCVGGFVVDRVIYLIRWRPYYVWVARRERRRRLAKEADHEANPSPHAYGAYPYPSENDALSETERPLYPESSDDLAQYEWPADNASTAQSTSRYHYPQGNGYAHPETDYITHTEQYAPAASLQEHSEYIQSAGRAGLQTTFAPAIQPNDPAKDRTRRVESTTFQHDKSFAPTAFYTPIPYQAPIQPEPLTAEPRFDEDFVSWSAPQNAYDELLPEPDLARGLAPSFGSSQPEPTQYLEDVQAGYAPRPSPEQRYNPRPQPEPLPYEQVHPGLDSETFQQNIGIMDPDALVDAERRNTDPYADFTPFPVAAQQDSPTVRSRGLGAIAKKARTFISGDDERNPRSINDLQTNVNMKTAFHAPVYPKKKPESEEE